MRKTWHKRVLLLVCFRCCCRWWWRRCCCFCLPLGKVTMKVEATILHIYAEQVTLTTVRLTTVTYIRYFGHSFGQRRKGRWQGQQCHKVFNDKTEELTICFSGSTEFLYLLQVTDNCQTSSTAAKQNISPHCLQGCYKSLVITEIAKNNILLQVYVFRSDEKNPRS